MSLDMCRSLCSNDSGGYPLNAVHCIINHQPPGVAAPLTGAFSLAGRAPLSFVSAGLIGQAQGGEINLVLVENSTGEEIMVIRGKVYNAKKLAKQVVQQIQQHSM